MRRSAGRPGRRGRGGPRRRAPLGLSPHPLPAPLEAYLEALVERVRGRLGDELVAVILSGSAATGSFAPGSSDADVMVIARGALGEPVARALAAELDHSALPCPARKLELVVYPRDAVRPPSRNPRFALNLNTGAGLPTHRSLDPGEEPWHWFLLDLALARERGRSLLGPPPEAVVGSVSRPAVLEALADSLNWHDAHEAAGANAVLNACRAWRFAVEGSLGSKEEGAAWARERAADRELLDAALAAHRSGAQVALAPARVAGIVAAARAAVAGARQDLRNGST